MDKFFDITMWVSPFWIITFYIRENEKNIADK